MAIRGYNTREIDPTQYSTAHIKTVVKSLGLDIAGETANDFLCYCPFHSNRHTPSFSISRDKGAYICFNPSCGEFGTLLDLVKKVLEKNDYQALRFIASKESESIQNFDEILNDLLEEKPEFVEFDKNTIDKLHNEMKEYSYGRDYMHGRGFTDETLEYFNVGFSNNRRMVTVPVYSPDGICVGIVGRGVDSKEFKNSTGLPRSNTLFNINNAKRVGGVCIVTESAFDAMRVHQCGFPNVVATLGGHISSNNINLLNRYFNQIIIMTDSDDAGRQLGLNIANKLKHKDVLWASYTYGKIYPHNAKDAGDMTKEEIVSCIKNSVSDIEYRSWNNDIIK